VKRQSIFYDKDEIKRDLLNSNDKSD